MASSNDHLHEFELNSFFLYPIKLALCAYMVVILSLFYLLSNAVQSCKTKQPPILYIVISRGSSVLFANFLELKIISNQHKYTCEQARTQYVLIDVHFPEFQEGTLAKTTPSYTNKLILSSYLQLQGVHLLIHSPESHLGVQQLHTLTSIQQLLLCHLPASLSLFQGCPQLFNLSLHQVSSALNHCQLFLKVILGSDGIIQMQLSVLHRKKINSCLCCN